MSGKLAKYALKAKGRITEDKVIEFYYAHPKMVLSKIAQALNLHKSTVGRYIKHLPGYQQRKDLARRKLK